MGLVLKKKKSKPQVRPAGGFLAAGERRSDHRTLGRL